MTRLGPTQKNFLQFFNQVQFLSSSHSSVSRNSKKDCWPIAAVSRSILFELPLDYENELLHRSEKNSRGHLHAHWPFQR